MSIGFFRLCACLPAVLNRTLGRILGPLAWRLHPTRTISTNIGLCFAGEGADACQKIEKDYYRRAVQAFFDSSLALFGSAKQLRRRVSIRGREHVEQARAQGRPVILLAPHFLGLELGWARVSVEWPAVGMYRRTRYPLLNCAVFHARTRFGGLGIERYGSLKPLIRALRDGLVFYYLPDQDPDRGQRQGFVFAPFFGVPAATFTALGRLARMTDAVVIPTVTRQCDERAGYELVFHPPMENFPSNSDAADAVRMNAEIENLVRQYPDQYLWAYRRFKTRPDNAPSPYQKRKKRLRALLFARHHVRGTRTSSPAEPGAVAERSGSQSPKP